MVMLEPAVLVAAVLIDVPLKTMPPLLPLPAFVTLIKLELAPLKVPWALRFPPMVIAALLLAPTVIEPAVPAAESVRIDPVVIVGAPAVVTLIETVPPFPEPAPPA